MIQFWILAIFLNLTLIEGPRLNRASKSIKSSVVYTVSIHFESHLQCCASNSFRNNGITQIRS